MLFYFKYGKLIIAVEAKITKFANIFNRVRG